MTINVILVQCIWEENGHNFQLSRDTADLQQQFGHLLARIQRSDIVLNLFIWFGSFSLCRISTYNSAKSKSNRNSRIVSGANLAIRSHSSRNSSINSWSAAVFVLSNSHIRGTMVWKYSTKSALFSYRNRMQKKIWKMTFKSRLFERKWVGSNKGVNRIDVSVENCQFYKPRTVLILPESPIHWGVQEMNPFFPHFHGRFELVPVWNEQIHEILCQKCGIVRKKPVAHVHWCGLLMLRLSEFRLVNVVVLMVDFFGYPFFRLVLWCCSAAICIPNMKIDRFGWIAWFLSTIRSVQLIFSRNWLSDWWIGQN